MKLTKQQEVVDLMIDIYYKKHRDEAITKEALKAYVALKLSRCPFKENKGFCSNCKIHCYAKDYKELIKKVMRYSGPRMIYHHPLVAISHLVSTIRRKIHEKK